LLIWWWLTFLGHPVWNNEDEVPVNVANETKGSVGPTLLYTKSRQKFYCFDPRTKSRCL